MLCFVAGTKVKTLDGELDSVPFRWATDEEIASQMWKMTTKTNGISIKLKLENGESMIIQ